MEACDAILAIAEKLTVNGLLLAGLVYFKVRLDAANKRADAATERYIESLKARDRFTQDVRRTVGDADA